MHEPPFALSFLPIRLIPSSKFRVSESHLLAYLATSYDEQLAGKSSRLGILMSSEPSIGPDAGEDEKPEDWRNAESDNRSATAKAAEWSSRIMTISMEMVLPGLAGYWLDNKLGSKGVFMLLGFAAGSVIAFKQLLSIAKGQTNKQSSHRPLSKDPTIAVAEKSEKDKL